VLALYYQEECTQAEIGEILGVTESRVCQILGEATLRLRAQLEAEDAESPRKKPTGKKSK
jgi:RNA polymerase sigma factor for flagellar operon FliA